MPAAATSRQSAARSAFVNAAHFASAKGLTYLGWFNRTRNPNPEVLAECEPRHRLLTLASDQSDNLSFLARLPAHIGAQPPPWGGGPSRLYDPKRSYVALVFSDGDNIAFDQVRISVGGEDGHAQVSTIYLYTHIINKYTIINIQFSLLNN